ncbi:MAG: DUF2723 domain-containing protein [Candidatus Riflebacteria bacterium]|nr:DUF2723 domain-containing protein [Candidatus Riflebacteria bacterium]
MAVALWLVVVLIGLALFLPTLNPGITWYNSGELAAAAMTLDVPHPPGYPLFTRLANLALQVPLAGEPAWRVNALAAVLGALGAACFALWLWLAGLGAVMAGAAAVWMMGFATFWEQATNAEVYTLEILLLAGWLCASLACRSGPVGAGKGLAVGLCFALGVGNRPTFAGLALAAVPAVWNTGLPGRFGREARFGLLLGLVLGALPTLDLFLRLQNPDRVLMDPLVGQGFDGFWRVFTAADFRKALLVFPPDELFRRFVDWVRFMAGEGGPALLLLPFLAFFPSSRTAAVSQNDGTDRALPCIVPAGAWILLVNSGFVLNYNAFEAHTMLLPSVLALCTLAAAGVARWTRGRPGWGTGLLAVVAVCGVLLGASRLSPRDQEANRWALRMTAGVPHGSTLLVSNDVEFRPLWYLRLAHTFRPDLTFRLIDAVGPEEIEVLRQEAARRPVLGSLIYPPDLREKLRPFFRLEPAGFLTRLWVPPAGQPTGSQGTASPATPSLPVIPLDDNHLPGGKPAWAADLPGSPGGGAGLASTGPLAMPETHVSSRHPWRQGGTSDVVSVGSFLQPLPGRLRIEGAGPFAPVVFSYEYQVVGTASGERNTVVGAFLHRDDGLLPERHGVLVGYDVHRLGDLLPAGGEGGSGELVPPIHREFVLPEGLAPGTWSVHLLALRPEPPPEAGVLRPFLPHENLLNLEGATEVFRLQYGVGDRPLVRASRDWSTFLQVLAPWMGGGDPVDIGRFGIPPANP